MKVSNSNGVNYAIYGVHASTQYILIELSILVRYNEDMNADVRELCSLDVELYKCISEKINTDRVVLTEKSDVHIVEHHPDAYKDVLIELKDTILNPDYILKDDNHADTGLVIREIASADNREHTFIVLKICTDSEDGKYANSIISGWKISEKRLQSYIRKLRSIDINII